MMQKLLVVLICITFSIPSHCCDVDTTCCANPQTVSASCCSPDHCHDRQVPSDSKQPCCDQGDTSTVFLSNWSEIESPEISKLHLRPKNFSCSSTLNGLTKLSRFPDDSLKSLRGRYLRIRLQSWLC